MAYGHLRQPVDGGAPSPLVWVPAWVLLVVGATIVFGGVVYFVRRVREPRRAAGRVAPRLGRRPPGASK